MVTYSFQIQTLQTKNPARTVETKKHVANKVRGRLHGEFQPGLKFQPAHRAEILLRLHG